jgi:hypothetical protein
MPSTSKRSVCFTSSVPPTEHYAISDFVCSVSNCTLCSALLATQASMGDCWPWGRAGEELLSATLFGTAGRRPNRGCGPRAAAEAARHNVAKPHRRRPTGTQAVSGLRERRAKASAKPEQVPQGAACRGLRTSRGPQVDRRSGTIVERSRRHRTRRSICHL